MRLSDLARHHGGIEDDDYSFHFDPDGAIAVARALGASLNLPEPSRPVVLRANKRGQLIAECDKRDGDQFPGATIRGKRNQTWHLNLRVSADQRPDAERLGDIDPYLRCLVAETASGQTTVGRYMPDVDGAWTREPDNYLLRCRLIAAGVPRTDIEERVGLAVRNPWRLASIPFGPEYPASRTWNLGAPQLTYQPVPGPHPHWDMVLRHCGADLDGPLAANPIGDIDSGYRYLLAWVACLIRHPFDRLPYLFFYGEQNSGKSIFHEALALLMTKGVAAGDRALTSDFNGELAGAVLVYIEEKDVSKAGAYNRLKDWVTSPKLAIRKLFAETVLIPNALHFVQCANDRGACPVEFGDTRIVAARVARLETEIPKPVLIARLKEEAPAFVNSILQLSLPEPQGRLRLPIIETAGKEAMAAESLPEIAVAIADAMADRSSWRGTASELPELLGPGEWPKTMRRFRTALENNSAFLRSRGITYTFPPRTAAGQPVELKAA